MTQIAFIGLGNMGEPMAANLVRAGHKVTGFDLDQRARDLAAKRGVAIAAEAGNAVGEAEIVVTMLPTGAHVRKVWAALLPQAKPGALFVDCSTVDVDSARAVHDMAAEAKMLSLDAPVSGGTSGARGASLTFMVGGDKRAFAKAAPVLGKMGKKIVHCGEAGSGQAAKICNNMILGISMIAVSEAFVLAEKLGLDHKALYDVASTSSGQCWSLTNYCPVPGPVPTSPANTHYKPGFAAELMLKDLKLSQEAAAACGAKTPLGAGATQLYDLFAQSGHAALDFSAIINLIRGSAQS